MTQLEIGAAALVKKVRVLARVVTAMSVGSRFSLAVKTPFLIRQTWRQF